ncbi:hypothetical protein [Halosimplex salinum]|uniref:hypothetical protein n=1 Tax=Halosimplex salinum TaxID=1710538 RepID=UPI000F4647FA|nr:hypothetical protein [Halosimplex salinum]
MTASTTTDGVAERVVLRYAPATDRVTEELATSRYSAYLRRAEDGPVAAGDAWDHFVSCGCGTTKDVTLTVDAVEGGDHVGADTEFTFVPAEGGDATDEADSSE